MFQQGGARFDPLRVLSSRFESTEPNFGIMFDIDGVIVRGRTVLPFAPEAFSKLFDHKTQQFKE